MSRWAYLVLVAGLCLKPLAVSADETQSIVSYGMQGLTTGAGTGLAIAFLSTGSEFESSEWKNLLIGTGVGALAGLGIGIIVGVVDTGASPHANGPGMYIIRDMNLGLSLGALAGGIIGTLVWATSDDGVAKDVLYGLAWGALIGVGAGLVLGIIEGSLRSSGRRSSETVQRGLRFDLAFTPPAKGAVPMPYPTLSGRF
jgi:hypothetical protein